MKSTAPWSVKGIARDTRETAKEAARKEGMTVGEWLNQIIHKAGSSEMGALEDLDGISANDLVTAIDHLNRRLAKGEESSDETVNKISTVLDRLEKRLSRVEKSAGGPDGGSGGTDIPADLIDRLEAVEKKALDRTKEIDRIDALRSLERAIGQIAVQFDSAQKTQQSRIDATEQQLQAITSTLENLAHKSVDEEAGLLARSQANRLDAIANNMTAVQATLREMTKRQAILEQKLNETPEPTTDPAADPQFAERTGKRLRVLGDEIKRGGDQVRSLETLISRLADQIDAAEQRSAEGIQKVSDAVASLRGKLGSAAAPAVATDLIQAEIARATEARFAQMQAELARAPIGTPIEAKVQPSAKPATNNPLVQPSIKSPARATSLAGVFDPAQIFDVPTPEPTSTPPRAATGSLYDEDDGEEISVEGDFSAAFDDLDFDEEESPVAAEQDVHLTSDNLEVDLDDDADEARRIAAEINQALNSNDFGDFKEQTQDPSSRSTRRPDPYEMPNERVTRPRAQRSQIEDDLFAEDPFGEGVEETIASAPEPRKQPTSVKPAAEKADPLGANPGKLPRTAEGKIDIARLTPKQKAVLAARARKKRQEAIETAENIVAPRRNRVVSEVTVDNDQLNDERDQINVEQKSILANVRGLFSRDRNSVAEAPTPRAVETTASKKKADSLTEIDNSLEPDEDRSSGPLALFVRNGQPTLISIATLGILIFLALLFIASKLLFAAKSTDRQVNDDPVPSISRPVTDDTTVPALIETPAPTVEDTVRPRALFLETMAILETQPDGDVAQAAFDDLEKAASLGYPPAQFQLGEFYKNGTYVEKNAGRARTWFQRSASGGNVFAMHRLGYLYAEGEGGSADIVTAIQWFEEAANLGFVDSMFNLGAIFDPGTGKTAKGVKDLEKAYFWYALAALNGDSASAPKAAGVGERLTSERKAVVDEQISDWRALPVNRSANENLSDG